MTPQRLSVFSAIFIFVFFAFTPSSSYGQGTFSDIEITMIRFFESGHTPPDESQRVFSTRFPKSTARFVNCQIDVNNKLYGVRDHTHQVAWKYYKPDGSLFGELKSDFVVYSSLQTSWKGYSLGWDNPGNWSPGTYTVDVYIDGQYAGQRQFTIFDDRSDSFPSELQVSSVQFFESEYTTPEQPQRKYAYRFPKSSTRYVYCEIDIDRLLQTADRTYKTTWKYYYPDGSFMGEMNYDLFIDSDSYSAWHGYGWEEAGHWTPGTYTAYVFIDDKKAGQGQFTIYDDLASTGPVLEYEIKSIRFFEGPSDSPPVDQRIFTYRFPKSTTRYVKCQVDVTNLLYQKREHSHVMRWKYYNTDGSLFGEMDADFVIKPEWSNAWQSRGYGWSDLGNWTPGTYAVEVFLDNNKVGKSQFEIYDDLSSITTSPTSLADSLAGAINSGSVQQVKSILDQGADPNAKLSNDEYPLASAVKKGQAEVVKLLLEYGADANANDRGVTVLMSAARGGSPEIVRALLEYGANTSTRDEKGRTALSIAEFEQNTQVLDLLRQAEKAVLSELWEGKWSRPGGYAFDFTMVLKVESTQDVQGSITWTLKDTPPDSSIRSKIGLKAVEYVQGFFNRGTRVLEMIGFNKDDPNEIIALDRYKLVLSLDGVTLIGMTYAQGKWEGEFSAERRK